MDTQHGELGRIVGTLCCMGVEHVEGSAVTIEFGDGDQARPGGIEFSQRWRQVRGQFGWRCHGSDYQTSSSTPAFKPDPMPMHSTRSPA